MQTTDWASTSREDRKSLLSRPGTTNADDVAPKVREIIAHVRGDGDDALRELTRRFDRVNLGELRVTGKEMVEARTALSDTAIDAIDVAITNVRRFHEQQMPAPVAVDTMPGVRCERVSRPIDAVGLYVPAGTAPLPSAAVMLAVPAAVAGCPTRVMCTPPRADGRADPAVVVAAQRAGIENIYKVGGAQAIAALAYGTATIPGVDKIFGPGNAWVTAAKMEVSNDPCGAAIDLPAGPSEVLVIADDDAVPEFVAADLVSQAEHGTDSQVVLVTTSRAIAKQSCERIEEQLTSLPRADIARAALRHSRIIVVDNCDEAVSVSNEYAPEHLVLHCSNARDLVAGIRNAGSVFVGKWTPESVGDYCSGTNHVLPTNGYARNYSGLGVDQFMRQMTVQELTRDGLAAIGGAVVTLATLEGLEGHAAAVTRRLGAAK
ncbi:MAG: histidinol dehydrogenase [Woeseiaceae bacterium]